MEEAKKIQIEHKKWIVAFLQEKENNECSGEEMFQQGEEHHCDTLTALLRSMKRAKIIDYPGMILMDTASDRKKVIKLLILDYDPETEL